MASGYNKCVLVGNISTDLEAKQTATGISVCSFNLAVNRRFPTQDGQKTDFIPIVAFKHNADFLVRYLKKGRTILVSGAIQTRNYTNSQGQKVYVTEIIADEIGDIIGEENLLEHIVDLTADDGLKCYGTIKSKMSLFTANMVRENVEILDEFKLDEWWWTCTPYSTPKHENSSWVKSVSPRGGISDCIYCSLFGVRPFCIVKSSIFVS